MLLLLVALISFNEVTSFDIILSTNEGTSIQDIGKIQQFTSYDKMNLLLRIDCSNWDNVACPGYDTPDDLELDFTTLIRERDEFVSSRLMAISIHNRKRQLALLGFLVGPLISAAGVGLTEYQIHGINEHLKKTTAEVEKISSSLKQLKINQLLFEKQTVAVLKNTTRIFYSSLQRQSCKSLLYFRLLDIKTNLLTYYEVVDKILYPIISGHNRMLLNPAVIDVITLSKIVQTHPIFSNSIFSHKPGLLYSTSFVTVVAVNDNLDIVHLVLDFPKTPRPLSTTLLEVKQVGLHRGNNICTYFDLPNHIVVLNNGTFQTLNVDHCTNHNEIYFCNEHAFSRLNSCIQSKSFNCTFYHTNCPSKQEFIKSFKGILFRNNIPKSSFSRDIHGKISTVPLNDYDLGHLYWSNISELQLSSISIQAPSFNEQPISITTFGTNLSLEFIPTLSPSSFSNLFQTLMHQHDLTLDDLVTSTVHDPSYSMLTYILVSVFGFIFLVTSTTCVVLFIRARKPRTNQRIIYHTVQDPTNHSMPNLATSATL